MTLLHRWQDSAGVDHVLSADFDERGKRRITLSGGGDDDPMVHHLAQYLGDVLCDTRFNLPHSLRNVG